MPPRSYYQQDGTYQGGVSDFKEGWDVVAKACRQIAPKVKMWYTPNVASLDQYDQYFPDDASTVDLIGVDWYPKQTDNFGSSRSLSFPAFLTHLRASLHQTLPPARRA